MYAILFERHLVSSIEYEFITVWIWYVRSTFPGFTLIRKLQLLCKNLLSRTNETILISRHKNSSHKKYRLLSNGYLFSVLLTSLERLLVPFIFFYFTCFCYQQKNIIKVYMYPFLVFDKARRVSCYTKEINCKLCNTEQQWEGFMSVINKSDSPDIIILSQVWFIEYKVILKTTTKYISNLRQKINIWYGCIN